MNKRQQGYRAESLVANYLIGKGYRVIAQNYTIRGGEIDIIVEDSTNRVFVEVKQVDSMEDLGNYISSRKLRTLYKTIQFFNLAYSTDKQIRVDLVFVKDNRMINYSENISNT